MIDTVIPKVASPVLKPKQYSKEQRFENKPNASISTKCAKLFGNIIKSVMSGFFIFTGFKYFYNQEIMFDIQIGCNPITW